MTALLIKLLFLLFLFLSSVTDANASVVINEFQIEPDGASQWAELYNNGGENVDISGWFIDDSGGSEKFTIPSGTVLAPNACVSFASGKFNWNTSSSDNARLLSGDSVIDSYSYSGSTVPNISFARLPDGTGGWTTSTTPSRDKLNANGVLCYIPPTPTPTPTATPVPTPTNTPEPTSTSIPTPTKVPTPTQSKLPTPTKRLAPLALATMAGEVLSTAVAGATVSPVVLSDTVTNWRPLIVGLLMTGLGLALLSLVFVVKKVRETKESSNLL